MVKEYSQFNIYTKLLEELDDFRNGKIVIAGDQPNGSVRYLSSAQGGYVFSQRKVLNMIDLYYNSKFESGLYDSEGQRKLFLNITKFIVDVARKNTDIDTKDYLFIPDGFNQIWKSWLMAKQFKVWVRENDFGQLLNDLNTDYVKYGTCVTKKVGKEIVRVPLKTLRNTQDAVSLEQAMNTGGYVIEEHEYSYYELQQFPDWDVSDIAPYDGKMCVYERYGLVPKSLIDSSDETTDMVVAMAIIMPYKSKKGEQGAGRTLFIEQVKECPYEEAHWDKQDGRWLSIGEVENQFENQIARNMTANMRRRALLWGSKKLFQSTDESVQRNLVRDVKDGDIIHIGNGGNIAPIATESRNLAEYQSDENMWKENSKEKSFTFEVATGDSMPSGTPFRLGVLLANSVASHWDLKKENFGLFLKRSFFEQMIPIFKKETKEHRITVNSGDDDVQMLREGMINWHTEQRVIKYAMSDHILPPRAILRQQVEKELTKSPYFFIDVPAKFYDDAKFFMELVITDESFDSKQTVETLTTLYQTMAGKNDPRAERVLQLLLAMTGKNYQQIVGNPAQAPTPAPVQTPGAGGGAPGGGAPAIVTPGAPAIAGQ